MRTGAPKCEIYRIWATPTRIGNGLKTRPNAAIRDPKAPFANSPERRAAKTNSSPIARIPSQLHQKRLENLANVPIRRQPDEFRPRVPRGTAQSWPPGRIASNGFKVALKSRRKRATHHSRRGISFANMGQQSFDVREQVCFHNLSARNIAVLGHSTSRINAKRH